MKNPLALEREYTIQLIDPDTGRKTMPFVCSLEDLFISHAKSQKAIWENEPERELDPYVNLLVDWGLDPDAEDAPPAEELFMDIPLFRMSTLESLVKQEKQHEQA